MKTSWITFYSYKGGVGRSMALANIAAHLARSGRRVVMIDFDLEAPGLDSFAEFKHNGTEGVVEYVNEFLEKKTTLPIARFVHRCKLDTDIKGELWLMPSGKKDEKYATRLHHIDWNRLYDEGVAQPFIANWKAAIERVIRPDYVLIDSRTGLTDIGGVCTLHFPDIVVLIFALNRQNLDGIANVRRAIAGVKGRDPIQMVTVASPVPNLARDSSNPLANRLSDAERLLGGQPNAVIGYFPPVALVERVWTLDDSFPPPRIAEDYRALSTILLRRVQDGLDFLLYRSDELVKKMNAIGAAAVIDALKDGYGDRPDALRAIARLERVRNNLDESLKALEQALFADSSDNETLESLINQYRDLGRTSDLRRLIDDLAKRLHEKKSPSYYHNWFDIGQSFMHLNEPRKALDAYQSALKCSGDAESSLALMFNIAEARRRATKTIVGLDWHTVLALADNTVTEPPIVGDESTTESAISEANKAQAIHVAYAVSGDLKKADECLERAISLAAPLSRTLYIFSLETYAPAPVKEFIASTQSMRAAIAKMELWDGMKIPHVESS